MQRLLVTRLILGVGLGFVLLLLVFPEASAQLDVITTVDDLMQLDNPRAQYLIAAMMQSGLPTTSYISITPDTDPNFMMGTPGGYTAKIYWVDTRIEASYVQPGTIDAGGTIEFFETVDERIARDERAADLVAQYPLTFDPYISQGRMQMRLSRLLRPSERQQYYTWFMSLADPDDASA